ncbi:MAG: hypothetical protein B7Z79_10125 [Thiomonas sp. 20-64-9]|nr:MAG: hypothetical protein B7Z79_10125 [Thiomonas sp. 20-64-9]
MLGAPQARAELGRPLQMDIPVRLDGRESLPLSCVQAQAQAGESAGSIGALAIASQPAADGLTLALRSQQPLREPILIVRLHLACQFQRTQVYTLLVDPPAPELPMIAGSAIAAAPSAGQQNPSRPLQPVVRGGVSTSEQAGNVPPLRPPQRESKPLAVRNAERKALHPPVLRQREQKLRAPVRPVLVQPAAQSRLEMDDLGAADLMASPELRLATALPATLPNLSPEQRAQLGQLRQLIMDATAAPGEAQPTLQQINAMQARANVLQRQFEQASQQLQRSQSELALARAQRYSASVVYALVAALVALGALSFWLWRRGADPGLPQSPFVPASVARPHASQAAEMPFAAAEPTASATSVSAQASTIQPPVMPFGLPPSVDGRPLQPEIDAPHLDAPPPSTWGHSGFDWDSRFLQPMSPDKQVHVDELMDAGHLAEYFIEMGDDDRAMDLLEKSLDDSASDSFALPYLLLFDLYRKHDRKKEFESLFRRFGRRFNVAVPTWDAAAAAQGQGRDLLDYDRAMKLITLAWGEPQSVSVLEHMLLDDPKQHHMGFDLAAYRDLLMLYTVARDLFPDTVPTSAPIEHVELTTRLEPAGLSLDFELPLDTPSAEEASEPAASSEFKLLPRADEAPKKA